MRGTMNRVLRKLGLMPKRSTSASRRPATKKPTSASKTRYVPLQRTVRVRRGGKIVTKKLFKNAETGALRVRNAVYKKNGDVDRYRYSTYTEVNKS